MRKLSEINVNEGMWKSGLDRARNNTERLEDKLVSNIKSLKEVDLGLSFNFADDDLVVDGFVRFGYEKMMELIPFIEKHGWRIPNIEEMRNEFLDDDYFLNAEFETSFKVDGDDTTIVLHNTINNKQLRFNTKEYDKIDYWLLETEDDRINNSEVGYFTLNPVYSQRRSFMMGHTFKDFKPSRIRLVKDKK